MNASDKLADAQIERAIDLEAYKNSVTRRMINVLRDAQVEIRAQLAGELTAFGTTRLETMLQRIDQLLVIALQDITGALDDEFIQLTADELASTQGDLADVLGANLTTVPSVPTVFAASQARPFQGRVLSEWYQTIDTSVRRGLRDAVTQGFTQNESLRDITSRARAAGLTNERNLSSIIRTAVNHVSTFGRHALYEENSDLIRGWYFLATLDSRTTEICQAASVRPFHRLGEGERPPLHIGCRSVDIPILNSNIDGVPEGLRSSIDGQVPANLTYNDFLQRKLTGGDGIQQNVGFVRDVLGPARLELFRAGELDVSRFVNRQGRRLSLSEIRNNNAEAWVAAFGSSEPDAWRSAIATNQAS